MQKCRAANRPFALATLLLTTLWPAFSDAIQIKGGSASVVHRLGARRLHVNIFGTAGFSADFLDNGPFGTTTCDVIDFTSSDRRCHPGETIDLSASSVPDDFRAIRARPRDPPRELIHPPSVSYQWER
jgi:hypothetical protein